MKKQNHGYLMYVTKMELQQLMHITEERLDISGRQEERKSFTTADLWNIQRNRRSFGQRRFIM